MAESREVAAQKEARALRDSARQHKKASAFHRRAARRDMEALEKLKSACQAQGFVLSEDA